MFAAVFVDSHEIVCVYVTIFLVLIFFFALYVLFVLSATVLVHVCR